jgi:hypothetical protein
MDATPRILTPLSCLFFLAACPVRHARADMSFRTESAAESEPEDPWLGVAASRGSTVVAVWSKRRVLVSDNAGRSFRERLPGTHDVDGVAVQNDGAVYVLRHRMLGVLRAGTERWRRLPFAGFPSLLAAGAGRVVWLGHQRARPTDSENPSRPYVAVSSDDGDTWSFQRPSNYQELYLRRASVFEDGRIAIDVTFGDCRSWNAVMRGRVDGTRWHEDGDASTPPVSVPHDARGSEWRLSDEGRVERRTRANSWVTVRLPG